MNPRQPAAGAIDAAPAKRWCCCPQHEHRPVADSGPAAAKPTRSCRPGIPRLRALARLRPAVQRRRECRTMANGVPSWPADHPASGPAAPTPSDRRGDYLGCRVWASRCGSTLSEAACDLLAKLRGDHHEIVTIIEGEGSPKPTPAGFRMVGEQRPDVSAEVHQAGSRFTPTALIDERRTSLARPDRCRVLAGVGDKKRQALPTSGSHHSRPADLLPRRYHDDRRRSPSVTCRSRSHVWPPQEGQRPPTRNGGACGRRRVRRVDLLRVASSTSLAGQALRQARGHPVRKLERYRGAGRW